MRPRQRIRKMVKWGGLALTLLIAALRIGTDWQPINWVPPKGGRFSVSNGWVSVIQPAPNTVWNGDQVTFLGPRVAVANPTHHPFDWAVLWRRDSFGTHCGLALLVPFWLGAYITGFAWCLDYVARRRIRAGFCPKCDYDRTGLAPGSPCPECGPAANRT